MKLEETDFIYLDNILKFSESKWTVKDVCEIEAEIIEILSWNLSSNHIFTFWEQYKYIYMSLLDQEHMNLYLFEDSSVKLLTLWIKDIRVYNFTSELISLVITWITILTNFDPDRDSDFILEIAEKWLINKPKEFDEWWDWILNLYGNTVWEPIPWLETPKFLQWERFIKNPTLEYKKEECSSPSVFSIESSKITTCNTVINRNLISKISQKSIQRQWGFLSKNSAFTSPTMKGYIKASFLRTKQIYA